jgi:hypothetical protein
MTDQKDQVQTQKEGEQSKEKKSAFEEKFNKGWDELELLTSQENETAKAKVTTEDRAVKKETEKKPDVSTPEKKPFKILKVQGKDVPVMTEEDYDALASKGMDYTKKTQTLADDRRAAEGELQAESKRLADEAKRFNDRLDELVKAKSLPKEMLEKTAEAIKEAGGTSDTEDEATVYKEFEIDPKYAQPFEVKSVKEIARQRKELAEIKTFTQEIARERANVRVNTIITKERETYPYEDVVDDEGQNITERQLASIVTAKREAAAKTGEKPDPERWIRDAVKEVHLSQKKVKETLVPTITDDMDLDTIMAKNPALADKIKAKYGETKVDLNKDKIPPTLPTARRTVDTTRPKVTRPEGSKSMSDFLDAGFDDPETIKAITGG